MQRSTFIPTAIAAITLTFVCVAGAHAQPSGSGPKQTKQEILAGIRLLEKQPLHEKGAEIREKIVKWLIDAPDFSLNPCPVIVNYVAESDYKYQKEVVLQVLLGAAAYVLQHGNSMKEAAAVQRAGVMSAIRAYEVILAAEPDVHLPALDSLIRRRNEGTLDAWVNEKLGECAASPTTDQ